MPVLGHTVLTHHLHTFEVSLKAGVPERRPPQQLVPRGARPTFILSERIKSVSCGNGPSELSPRNSQKCFPAHSRQESHEKLLGNPNISHLPFEDCLQEAFSAQLQENSYPLLLIPEELCLSSFEDKDIFGPAF